MFSILFLSYRFFDIPIKITINHFKVFNLQRDLWTLSQECSQPLLWDQCAQNVVHKIQVRILNSNIGKTNPWFFFNIKFCYRYMNYFYFINFFHSYSLNVFENLEKKIQTTKIASNNFWNAMKIGRMIKNVQHVCVKSSKIRV